MTQFTFEFAPSYDAFYCEAASMIAAHWDEVGSNREILKLNPDHHLYRNLEKVGALRILVARCDKEMAGYFTMMKMRHPRDVTVLIGKDDAIYAKPEYRRALLGKKLVEAGIEDLKRLGCQLIFFGEKVRRYLDDDAEVLHHKSYLSRWGFKPQEVIHCLQVRENWR